MPEVRELCRTGLYFDTAAVPFLYQPSVYRAVIEAVGADRLLLGTDHPLLRAPRYLDTLRGLGLGEEATAAVLGGNAARLLRL
jgi:predicted TIM-barrel fold metal-dependent hydrolase